MDVSHSNLSFRRHGLWVIGPIFLLALLSVTALADKPKDPPEIKDPQKYWLTWGGQQWDKMPEVIRNGSRLDQARYLVTQTCNRMSELGIKPNDSLPDRGVEFFTPGSPATSDDTSTGVGQGTCGDVSKILGYVLGGPGFSAGPWRFGVPTTVFTEVPPDSISNHRFAVNRNHIATALEIDGEVYVFDPWAWSYKEHSKGPTYSGFGGKNIWNGMPVEDWAGEMEELGYDRFRMDPYFDRGQRQRPMKHNIKDVVELYVDDLDLAYGVDRSRTPDPSRKKKKNNKKRKPDIGSLGALIQRPGGIGAGLPENPPPETLGVSPDDKKKDDEKVDPNDLTAILGANFDLGTGNITGALGGIIPGGKNGGTEGGSTKGGGSKGSKSGNSGKDKMQSVFVRGTVDRKTLPLGGKFAKSSHVSLKISKDGKATLSTLLVTHKIRRDKVAIDAVETVQFAPASGDAIMTDPPRKKDELPLPVLVDFEAKASASAAMRAGSSSDSNSENAKQSWRAERRPDGSWIVSLRRQYNGPKDRNLGGGRIILHPTATGGKR